MKIKELLFLPAPQDLFNESVDVIITVEDDLNGKTTDFIVEVTTPQFLSVLMEGKNFLAPEPPYIIVSKLTKEIIWDAVQAFVDENDAYWLKVYHLAPSFSKEELNEILYRRKQEYLEIEAEIEAETKLDSDIND